MRPYEVMVILDAGLEDDVIRDMIDRATQVVTAGGGTVNRVDRWGKRRFAYEVHHRTEGYYALIEMSADPDVVASLERVLSLADQVVRHKVIRLPDKVAARVARSAQGAASASATSTNGA